MGRALADGDGMVPAGKGVFELGARLVNTDGIVNYSGLLLSLGTDRGYCGRHDT
jgi:hypothetical protein